MTTETILIIGSNGQIGTELAEVLRANYGTDNVVCSDLKKPEITPGPFEIIDIMDREGVYTIIKKYVLLVAEILL